MSSTAESTASPDLAAARAELDKNGFLIIPGALTQDEVAHYRDALDRVYQAQEADGRIKPGASMHQLSAVANCPELAFNWIDGPPRRGFLDPGNPPLGEPVRTAVPSAHLLKHVG